MACRSDAVRRRPPLFRALGGAEPPQFVSVAGRTCRLAEVMKHDSWAATATYSDQDGRLIICKFNRLQPIFVLPMAWLGRVLARREARFLDMLADLDAVPGNLGPVEADGEVLANAVSRAFIEGAPLYKSQRVNDGFFAKLEAVVRELHARGITYNDLNKKENVLVGSDGEPYLIDFQISLAFSQKSLKRNALARWIKARLAEFDLFHVAKHVIDCRPDLLSAHELEAARTPPALLRWHRRIAGPLRRSRRRLLVLAGVRSGEGFAHTEAEPEDAVRRSIARGDR